MAKKEGKNALVAAYEYSKHEPEVRIERERELRNLAERFDTTANSLLNFFGIPGDENPDLISTPQVTLETGRGDVLVNLLGTKDSQTGLFKRISIEVRYGEFKPPFIAPKKPGRIHRPLSIGVNYDQVGNLKTSKYDLPKLKTLRQVHEVLGLLWNSYASQQVEAA